jgi:hypothetical protein
MTSVIVGKPSIVFNGQTIKDFGTQEFCKVSFPDEISTTDLGFGGNAIYGFKESGRKAVVDLVSLVNGDCDKVLSDWLTTATLKGKIPYVFNMQITGEYSNENATQTTKTMLFRGGVVNKRADATYSTEGGADQGQRNYTLTFVSYNELNS